MSFGIYIVGYIILIVGLAMGAHLLHLPQKWIVVGVICLVGLSIVHGVTASVRLILKRAMPIAFISFYYFNPLRAGTLT
jgi:hypothetical protein